MGKSERELCMEETCDDSSTRPLRTTARQLRHGGRGGGVAYHRAGCVWQLARESGIVSVSAIPQAESPD
jgi:hypothetical protein